jgi:ankyrin repeat protein
MLIVAGANPDIVGGDTFTPLNLASSNGHLDCVKVLIANNVNIDNRIFLENIYHSINGGTALRDALLNLLWDVADILIDAGASVQVLNEKCLNGEDFFEVITQFAKNSSDPKYNILRVEQINKLVNES